MTRFNKAALTGLAAVIAAVSGAQSGDPIQVKVDGNAVYFPKAQPVISNDRVLVPLRGVFEELGAVVAWSRSDQRVSAIRGATDVELHIGSNAAKVNGSTVDLDVPATIINGSTMVPIRFVSEALGAQVGWAEAQQIVSISTAGQDPVVMSPAHRTHRAVIRMNEVIPWALDSVLSTSSSRRGDKFTATIRTGGLAEYGGIQNGTKVEGHVAAVHPMEGDRPGIIDLAFDRLLFPDGYEVQISGTLTSLDDKHVVRHSSGVLTVDRDSASQGERMVYAGFGTGGGQLVEVQTTRPLDETALVGELTHIRRQVPRDLRLPRDVTLSRGTVVGLRITQDVTARW